MSKNKKAALFQQTIVEIIIVGLVFGLFFLSLNYRVQSTQVKQEILEKQTALLIDAAERGMQFEIYKKNMNGFITKMEIKNGKIFSYIDNSQLSKGYDFFSPYNVELEQKEDRFVISIK